MHNDGKSSRYRLAVLGIAALLACPLPAFAQTNQTVSADATAQQIQQKAQAGDADAQYAYGYLLFYGKGVTQNTEQARQWISKSAAQGQPQAAKALEMMGVTAVPTTPNNVEEQPLTSPPPAFMSKKIEKLERSEESEVGTPLVMISREESDTADVTKVATTTKVDLVKPVAPAVKPAVKATATLRDPVAVTQQGYTLQLSASSDEESAQEFIEDHDLENRAKYYLTQREGRTWYVVVMGQYADYKQATQAIQQLPASLKSEKPWVRSFDSLKGAKAHSVQAQ